MNAQVRGRFWDAVLGELNLAFVQGRDGGCVSTNIDAADRIAALAAPKESGDYLLREIDRALNGDVLAVLMDVQNGIDSPGLVGMANSAIRRLEYVKELAARLAAPSKEAGAPWEAKYLYALTLIDAAAEDGDGMAGVAFSAQVPMNLIEGKSASQIAALMCDDANPPGDQRQECPNCQRMITPGAHNEPAACGAPASPLPEAAAAVGETEVVDGWKGDDVILSLALYTEINAASVRWQQRAVEAETKLAALASPTGPQLASADVVMEIVAKYVGKTSRIYGYIQADLRSIAVTAALEALPPYTPNGATHA